MNDIYIQFSNQNLFYKAMIVQYYSLNKVIFKKNPSNYILKYYTK